MSIEPKEGEEFLPSYDLRAVLAKLQRLSPVSLEELLCSPEYFGLTTASPLQRAICRIVDGIPLGELGNHRDVLEALGTAEISSLLHGKPLEVDILSGIRSGKSLFAAAAGIHWAQTCDFRGLSAGDVPRVSILSLSVDNSGAVYRHILGALENSPKLQNLLVCKPTSDTITLAHPSGRPVEIKVVAGSRAGGSLVSRWSAGCILDEYTRMVGAEAGVINYSDMRDSVLGRLRPGAQLLSIGSPWQAAGPAYSRFIEGFGKPSESKVIIKAPGWCMNPMWWTPERVDGLKRDNPDVYRSDCAAEFMNPEDSMFHAVDMENAIRAEPLDLEYDPNAEYCAAMDPGTRSNAWTLILATRKGTKRRVAIARQWQGTQAEPLDPDLVMGEVARICKNYKVTRVMSDQVMVDALRSIARNYGIYVDEVKFTSTTRLAAYTNLKLRLGAKEIELPPDRLVRDDLLRVRKRIVSGGAQIILPETSDGRHCDYAPAVVLAMSKWMNDVRPERDNSELAKHAKDEDRMWKAAAKRWKRQK